MTGFNGSAPPPEGVKVTELMVRLVVPQFQDTPTSISLSVPDPVVCPEMERLVTEFPELLETAPSWLKQLGTVTKLAVTVLSPSMVTVVLAEPGLATFPLQPAKS